MLSLLKIWFQNILIDFNRNEGKFLIMVPFFRAPAAFFLEELGYTLWYGKYSQVIKLKPKQCLKLFDKILFTLRYSQVGTKCSKFTLIPIKINQYGLKPHF